MSAGFRPLAPDARGFGNSSYPREKHHLTTLAEDMVGLLEYLKCGPAHMVGISLGGITALQLALDHPGLVRRLILINATARLFPDDLRTTIYYVLRLLMVMTVGIERQAHLVAHRIFPLPEEALYRQMLIKQIMAADPSAYRRTMLALARFNVSSRLKSLKTPTLVLTGSLDTTILPHRQTQLAAGIPGARHIHIPAAGHAATVQRPDEVNSLILEFLKSEPGPSELS
jgi:pimeloyl-ACP methyl ester carboxylesterase